LETFRHTIAARQQVVSGGAVTDTKTNAKFTARYPTDPFRPRDHNLPIGKAAPPADRSSELRT